MKLVRIPLLAALGLGLAFGTAQAADSASKDSKGFNELDKDDNGALSRSEAAGKPELLARFKDVDGDGNGELSHFEYLQGKAKDDFRSLREKAADFIEPNDKSPASRGSSK